MSKFYDSTHIGQDVLFFMLNYIVKVLSHFHIHSGDGEGIAPDITVFTTLARRDHHSSLVCL
jgi:hypothetical protein